MAEPRKPIPKRLRFEVFRRDDFRCRYCGAEPTEKELTVDHVVPIVLGGESVPENLATACRDCNAGKTSSSPDTPLVADVEADTLRWAQAMKHATEIQAAKRNEHAEVCEAFFTAWGAWRTKDGTGDALPLPPDWRNSIGRFFDEGLDAQFMAQAVDTALGSNWLNADKAFRYFCSICWRHLRERQELARQVLATGLV